MPTVLEKPKKATKKATEANLVASAEEAKQENATPIKKKSLLDIAKELAEHPLFTINEKDRDLIYGSNMMTRLLQEEELWNIS